MDQATMIPVFKEVLLDSGEKCDVYAALVYGVIWTDCKRSLQDRCYLRGMEIAKATGLSVTTVYSALARLRRKGWLTRSSRKTFYSLTEKAPKLTARELALLLDPYNV